MTSTQLGSDATFALQVVNYEAAKKAVRWEKHAKVWAEER